MRSAVLSPFLCALLGSCTIPRTIDSLQENCPPPEFGRPGWVRTAAGAGGWIGGLVGGVVSIVLIPVTLPVSLLAGDGFTDRSRSEFLLLPATGGAALGHFLLGTPCDFVDYMGRRVWSSDTYPPNTYEVMPMESPKAPVAPPPPPQPAKAPVAPAGQGQAPK